MDAHKSQIGARLVFSNLGAIGGELKCMRLGLLVCLVTRPFERIGPRPIAQPVTCSCCQ